MQPAINQPAFPTLAACASSPDEDPRFAAAFCLGPMRACDSRSSAGMTADSSLADLARDLNPRDIGPLRSLAFKNRVPGFVPSSFAPDGRTIGLASITLAGNGIDAQATGDLGPAALPFIPARESPDGSPLLVLVHEVSDSTTIVRIEPAAPAPPA